MSIEDYRIWNPTDNKSLPLITGTNINLEELSNGIRISSTGGGSLELHGLDPLDGYHSGTLRASLSTVVDAGNYYTGSTVEDILQEIYPRTTGTGGSTDIQEAVERTWMGL